MNIVDTIKDTLLRDGEAIAEFTVYGYYYTPGYCIVPDDRPTDRLDIAGCLEETLHRIIEEKHRADNQSLVNHPFFNDSEEGLVRQFMLADQDLSDEDEGKDATEIDSGYRIHGPLISFRRVPLTADSFERKLYERYKLLWMLDQGITLQEAFAEWRDYCDPANGMDPGTSNEDAFADWESNSGFSGSLYVCFDEFLNTEYKFDDERLMPWAEEREIWKLDQS
jgi:hypothetical protein